MQKLSLLQLEDCHRFISLPQMDNQLQSMDTEQLSSDISQRHGLPSENNSNNNNNWNDSDDDEDNANDYDNDNYNNNNNDNNNNNELQEMDMQKDTEELPIIYRSFHFQADVRIGFT